MANENTEENATVIKDKVLPEPIANKTYRKDKLYLGVHLVSTDDSPLSYQRIYADPYHRMLLIRRAVMEFYTKHMLNGKNTRKMTVEDLANQLKIPVANVRKLVLQMSSFRQIWKKEDGKWIIAWHRPMLVVQQEPKHVDARYFGKKTPLYIFSYEMYASEVKK